MSIKNPTINLKDKLRERNTASQPVFVSPVKDKEKVKLEKEETLNSFLQGHPEEKNNPFEFKIPLDKFRFDKFLLDKFKLLDKKYYRWLWIGLAAILLIILMLIFFRWRHGSTVGQADWYAVKLSNNEVYFGQVSDTKADPVAINNVYYDYQGKDENDQSNNLRLVKRGKESYGPSGAMLVVRSQIVYMEPLKKDSKVLQAILDYEK